jgi:hypothetical protein
MRHFVIALVAIIALAALVAPGSRPVATGQTVPPPVYLPLIQMVDQAAMTPTPTPTPTRFPTVTPTEISMPTLTPSRTPTSLPTSTSSPTPTNTPTQQPTGDMDIRNTSAFVPYEGSDSLYIVGEVINNTNGNVQFVRVNAVLRDAGGSIVTGGNGYSLIDTHSPGMTAPFRVSLFNVPAGWHTYDLTVNYSTSADGPIGLELSDIEHYFDGSNAFHARGNVRNQTGENREYVKIFVTLYDSAGVVIGADHHYVNPTDLAPGQQVLFDADVYFWNGKPDRGRIASYRVAAFDD